MLSHNLSFFLVYLSKGAFSLHRASDLPQTRCSKWTSDPPEMEWKDPVRLASDALSQTSDHLSPRDKMSLISLVCPTHQPIKWSSTDYLATFTRFWSHTRIIGKGKLFDFPTIFTQLTVRSCTEKRSNLYSERIEELPFFWSYGQIMVAVSGNTGSAHWLAPK